MTSTLTKQDAHTGRTGVDPMDEKYSCRALELAAMGAGLVSPNPLVGCVIVTPAGDVVGEGTYTYDGVTHAEVIALEEAGKRARGATAYVSLEPHSHHGKTPPCTDALIEYGIRRVVAPIDDPNPLVSGRGFAKLRESGIDVVTGIFADKAARLNEKFICWHKNKRPFVHLKLAMSLDGRISVNDSVSTALTSEEARAYVQELRHEYDAILIGSNTAVVDDPLLTDRSGKPRRRPLVRVVLDDRLRLEPNARLADTSNAPTIVFTRNLNDDAAAALRGRGVEVVNSEAGSRDLDHILSSLAKREIQSVLVEGGSRIAGAFLDEGLVDKVTFIAAPIIIGGVSAPVAVAGDGAPTLGTSTRLRNLTIEKLGDDIVITGYPMRGEIGDDKQPDA